MGGWTSWIREKKRSEDEYDKRVWEEASNISKSNSMNNNSVLRSASGSNDANAGRRMSSSSSSSGDILFFMQNSPEETSKPTALAHYPDEMTMPDATYEECYGDAYVDKPLKYIYPVGYEAMRPRSLPWKLSIGLCLALMWLTVFIVGHCADRSWKYTNRKVNNIGDDDALVLATRWCGSRPLYFAWLVTVFLTGLTCAYVAIIGYIKARDFAVANSRSQLPGMTSGRSDYYVFMSDAHWTYDAATAAASQQGNHDLLNSSQASYQQRTYPVTSGNNRNSNFQPDGTPRKTIFQSDGSPAFWGTHIYKPTQAAVAITHR